MTHSQLISAAIEYRKETCKKTNETYNTLKARGYRTVTDLAGINTPSSLYYSAEENRMFLVGPAGVSEVVKLRTRFKKNQAYKTVFEKA